MARWQSWIKRYGMTAVLLSLMAGEIGLMLYRERNGA